MMIRNASGQPLPVGDRLILPGQTVQVPDDACKDRFVAAWIDAGALRAELDPPAPEPVQEGDPEPVKAWKKRYGKAKPDQEIDGIPVSADEE